MINLCIYVRCHPVLKRRDVFVRRGQVQRSGSNFMVTYFTIGPTLQTENELPLGKQGCSGANFDIGINTYFTICTALELSDKNNG